MKLYAPESYWTTTQEEIDRMTGGCGPGGWGDFLVPDNLDWPVPGGMSIFKSCRIHDYCYAIGKTLADKEAADRIFLNNMLRQIDNVGYANFGYIIRWRRRKRAWVYYKAVKRFGANAFWSTKNDAKEYREC